MVNQLDAVPNDSYVADYPPLRGSNSFIARRPSQSSDGSASIPKNDLQSLLSMVGKIDDIYASNQSLVNEVGGLKQAISRLEVKVGSLTTQVECYKDELKVMRKMHVVSEKRVENITSASTKEIVQARLPSYMSYFKGGLTMRKIADRGIDLSDCIIDECKIEYLEAKRAVAEAEAAKTEAIKETEMERAIEKLETARQEFRKIGQLLRSAKKAKTRQDTAKKAVETAKNCLKTKKISTSIKEAQHVLKEAEEELTNAEKQVKSIQGRLKKIQTSKS